MMSSQMQNTKQKNLCFLLVKNRLMAQTGLNVFHYEKDKRKKNGKIAVMVAIGMCIAMLIGYCSAAAYGYAYLGLLELIPGMAMTISSVIVLFFTMFKTNGEFFGFRDYDMIMSLPIPISTVVNSRFVNMYLWNTFFTILVMLPMGTIYFIFAKVTFTDIVFWILGMLLASLIPTTIAAVFGAVITAFSSKFRYASAVASILSIAAIVGLMVLSMSAGSQKSGLSNLVDSKTGNLNREVFSTLAPQISEQLNRTYPPVALFQRAVSKGDWLSFFLFAGISIGWYGLFVFLLSIKFRQINTALTSHQSKANYKMEKLYASSTLLALYKKTIARILKSTICATNLLIGCVMAILFSTAILVVGPEKMLKSMEMTPYLPVVKNAAGYVIAAMVSMTNTASVSLALEGKNIWLIQSLPIPPKKLYDSYLLTNLTFTLPTSVLCAIFFCVAFKVDAMTAFIIILTPVAFSLFTAVMGIFIGNRLAYYDWQDEVQLVKQSMMSLFGMLGGMVVISICGVVANSGIIPLQANLFTLLLVVLLFVLTVIIYKHESKRPIKE